MTTRAPVRVLVVDDSALMRAALVRAFEGESDIQVVGTAGDAYAARDLLVELRPDVITLDIDLPRMDGLAFLQRFMAVLPTPTVVISGLTEEGKRLALDCLDAGAVSVLPKPTLRLGADGTVRMPGVCSAVRAAAAARLPAMTSSKRSARRPRPRSGLSRAAELVVMGASTGGVQALSRVLRDLPEDMPPVLVVQHMPTGFSASFARRLDGLSALEVAEARDGELLRPGRVLVAPSGSDRHMELRRVEQGLVAALVPGPAVSGHRPSVDVLFRSAARVVGAGSVGVLMTGMGRDGAEGLFAMRQAGGRCFAQDEASSVVYGMPGAAARLGAVDEQLSVEAIAPRLQAWLQTRLR